MKRKERQEFQTKCQCGNWTTFYVNCVIHVQESIEEVH